MTRFVRNARSSGRFGSSRTFVASAPTGRATLAPVSKTTGGNANDLATYTTASITWGDGDTLLIGALSSNSEDSPSNVTATGLTWTEVTNVVVDPTTRKLSVWKAKASSAEAGGQTVSIVYPGTQNSCAWAVVAIPDTASTGDVVQSTTAGPTSGTSIETTLSAFEDGSNANVTFFGSFGIDTEYTTDADFTQLGVGYIASGTCLVVSSWANNEAVMTSTMSTTRDLGQISVEVKSGTA